MKQNSINWVHDTLTPRHDAINALEKAKQRETEKQSEKTLRDAFIIVICTSSIYKKLGCSKAYPAVIRAGMRKGDFPKSDTMRDIIRKAGWEMKSEEIWVKNRY